jgi:hypothetical protein
VQKRQKLVIPKIHGEWMLLIEAKKYTDGVNPKEMKVDCKPKNQWNMKDLCTELIKEMKRSETINRVVTLSTMSRLHTVVYFHNIIIITLEHATYD